MKLLAIKAALAAMKLTKEPSLHVQFIMRIKEIEEAHPQCNIYAGDVAPTMKVIGGHVSVVMQADEPLMVMHYIDRAKTQWLFDMYGQ